jgi:hypothetical protein
MLPVTVTGNVDPENSECATRAQPAQAPPPRLPDVPVRGAAHEICMLNARSDTLRSMT